MKVSSGSLLIVGNVVLLIACAVLAYGWLDRAVSADYARQEQAIQQRRVKILEQLLRLSARRASRLDFSRMLRDDFGGQHVVEEGPNTISVDGVTLRFEGASLVDAAISAK